MSLRRTCAKGKKAHGGRLLEEWPEHEDSLQGLVNPLPHSENIRWALALRTSPKHTGYWKSRSQSFIQQKWQGGENKENLQTSALFSTFSSHVYAAYDSFRTLGNFDVLLPGLNYGPGRWGRYCGPFDLHTSSKKEDDRFGT